jgi:hypothetical protein
MKKSLAIAAIIAATTTTAKADACMLDATSWLCEQQQMQQTGQANIFEPGSFMHQGVQRQRYGSQNYGTNIFESGSFMYNQHENNAMKQQKRSFGCSFVGLNC